MGDRYRHIPFNISRWITCRDLSFHFPNFFLFFLKFSCPLSLTIGWSIKLIQHIKRRFKISVILIGLLIVGSPRLDGIRQTQTILSIRMWLGSCGTVGAPGCKTDGIVHVKSPKSSLATVVVSFPTSFSNR